MKKSYFLKLSVLVAPFFYVFAGAETAPYRIGISQEFESLNPITRKAQATVYINFLVDRPLVTNNPEGQWVPQLAKIIPTFKNGGAKFVNKNGEKILQAVWEIRAQAKWGDGTPVTCKDFQLARDIAESPNVSLDSKDYYTIVKKVDWDPARPKTCTFVYAKPIWNYYQIDKFFPVPAHLEAAVFQKFGAEKEAYERNSLFVKSPENPGLYNGPYKVSEIKLGSHVTVVANPYFFGPAPKIPKIVVKLISDTGTLIPNLQSGTLDSIGSLGLTLDQALEFEKLAKKDKLPFDVIYKPSIAYEHVDFNLENPILKDLRVRRALATSINKQEMVHSLFEGKQDVANQFLVLSDSWASKDPSVAKAYAYDRRGAKKLLDQAGWIVDPKDGFRYKEGQKLSLPFMTTSGNKTRETLQTYLQAQWKMIGVEVTIKNETARSFFSETVAKRQFAGMVLFADSPQGNLRPSFHSKQIPTAANGWSGRNVRGWSNPQVDAAIDKMELEFDPEIQADLAHEVVRHYTQDVPAIPLFYRAMNVVNPKGLVGFKLPAQPDESAEAELWERKSTGKSAVN